jgi:hypothetical protein
MTRFARPRQRNRMTAPHRTATPRCARMSSASVLSQGAQWRLVWPACVASTAARLRRRRSARRLRSSPFSGSKPVQARSGGGVRAVCTAQSVAARTNGGSGCAAARIHVCTRRVPAQEQQQLQRCGATPELEAAAHRVGGGAGGGAGGCGGSGASVGRACTMRAAYASTEQRANASAAACNACTAGAAAAASVPLAPAALALAARTPGQKTRLARGCRPPPHGSLAAA